MHGDRGPFQLQVGEYTIKSWILNGERGVTLRDGEGTAVEFTPEAANALGIAIQAVAACARFAPEKGPNEA